MSSATRSSTRRAPDPRRSLPSVDAALKSDAARAAFADQPPARAAEAIRAALDRLRRKPPARRPGIETIVRAAADWLREDEFQRLRPVVNATGVVLHTNLGRAVLPSEAVRALATLDRCCSLQIDLETGARGRRHAMSERLLCRLTGAEAALVVNNNAAATLLVLAALCSGREVIVSRGQLIEIGGSYRLPDCVHQSGAILREVGTTNKTHLRDYAAAIGEGTAALMRVNPSNFRIIGFSMEVPIRELVTLRSGRPDLLVLDDLGCGALVDPRRFGLPAEPTVPESLRAGADLVFFSGDKLIGGPQSGLIVGRADLIERIRKHPLTRMLRVDKMTDLALEHTLRLFLEPERLPERHPTWRMLTRPTEALSAAAERMRRDAVEAGAPAAGLTVQPCESTVGGGTMPGQGLPSYAVVARFAGCAAEELLRRLRRHDPPVIGTIRDDAVWLDARTVMEDEYAAVASALAAAALRKENRSQ
ncbi:MAG: L-seryl-tRNA(Sec) selenium transferase [Kiritimatiellae bacterium]|nr:L-seryl-tRNA(Sec) selenium transferase [Kiritimatiellia bacterium]